METKTKSKQSSVKNEVVVQRVFDLPVSKVWQALTEPSNIKKWWGPKGFTCPTSSVNLKTGGKYLHCMRSSDGEDYWTTGVFKEIVPQKKLVYTDSFSNAEGNKVPASSYNMPGDWPMELLVTINLEEVEGKTKLKLRQEGVPEEMHDDCKKGWDECFDKLESNMK